MPRTKQAVPIERFTVRSQKEVGRALGITAMRVCQIEKSALRKLRAEFEKHGYELRQPTIITFPRSVLYILARWERENWERLWRIN